MVPHDGWLSFLMIMICSWKQCDFSNYEGLWLSFNGDSKILLQKEKCEWDWRRQLASSSFFFKSNLIENKNFELLKISKVKDNSNFIWKVQRYLKILDFSWKSNLKLWIEMLDFK